MGAEEPRQLNIPDSSAPAAALLIEVKAEFGVCAGDRNVATRRRNDCALARAAWSEVLREIDRKDQQVALDLADDVFAKRLRRRHGRRAIVGSVRHSEFSFAKRA